MSKAKVIHKDGLFVRKDKSRSSEWVRIIPCGEEFEFYEEYKGWLKVADGWVVCNDVYIKPTEVTPESVLSDWAIYDTTNEAHILNRPCYKDLILGEKVSWYVAVGTPSFTVYKDDYRVYELTGSSIKLGEKGSVFYIENDNYYGIVKNHKQNGAYQYVNVVGNSILANEYISLDLEYAASDAVEDTGEDFAIISFSSTAKTVIIKTISCETYITNGYFYRNCSFDLKTLDEEFIPDTIARKTDVENLPTLNSDNEFRGYSSFYGGVTINHDGYGYVNSPLVYESEALILKSSSIFSDKWFRITVDDNGTLTATEVTK